MQDPDNDTDKIDAGVGNIVDKKRSGNDIAIAFDCNNSWPKPRSLMLKAAGSHNEMLDDPAPEFIPRPIVDFAKSIGLRSLIKSDRMGETFRRRINPSSTDSVALNTPKN